MPYDPPAGYHPNMSLDSDISQTTAAPSRNKMIQSNPSDVRVDIHHVSRTPSPTPSEQAELEKTHLINFKAFTNWRFWIRREWLWYYVLFAVLFIITILFTVFHKQIVNWLQPPANKLKDLPAGWLVPIAIFIIISFPPLFGHEILAILCGLVWGLGVGFAIVAAGTFIGELANFYAFKYCCSARGEKYEKTQIQYACLARVVREGGFKIALIARFSAIPGHFTTAVFSTCGMSVWTFALAAFFSLPKQFLTVYLGVALEDSDTGHSSTKDTIIQDVVIGITVVVTAAAMWYIYHLMNLAKPKVIYDRRKARQAKLAAEGMGPGPYSNPSVLNSTTSVAFDGRKSESELPLTANFQSTNYQQWDAQGRAVGYAPDPTLYAPQPQRPVRVSAQTPGGSSSSTPAMSQRPDLPPQPLRQNTSSSSNSWDVQAHVGGQESYPMSRASPYKDPYSVPKIPPPTGPYSTTTAPSALQSTIEQTPVQAQFAYGTAGAPPGALPSPPSAPLSNPFDAPPPLPSDAQRGHMAQPTDASFYTAHGSHSPQPMSDDPYAAYHQQQPPAYR